MSFSELWASGKTIVSKKLILVLLPLIWDLIIFAPLAFANMGVVHVKLTLPTSLPTIQNLLPDAAQLAQGSSFVMGYPRTITSGFLGLVIIFLLMPYINGGYLGVIAEEIRQVEQRSSFIVLANRYFTRFLLMRLLVLAAFFILAPIFLVIPFLAILMVIFLLFLSILILFWDYSVVYDNIDVLPALSKAYTVFSGNVSEVARALVPIVLLMIPMTFVTSLSMSSPLLILMIILYAYLGAVFVSGIMSLYVKLQGKSSREI